jgi:Leucine-rich repeat (LRR) protein
LKLAHIRNVDELPDNIPPTATLQALIIDDSSLTNLPHTITRLTGLTSLTINSAELQQLPDQFTRLTGLTSLTINSAKLQQLPDQFTRLTGLTRLTINSAKLQQLPDQFTQLSSLRVLELTCRLDSDVALRSGLTALKRLFINISSNTLPAIDIGPLTRFYNIQSLSINHVVPDSIQFGVHTRLTSLMISCCPGLRELPASMGNLIQLRELKLHYNKSLERLPDEISRLTALTSLTINGYPILSTDAIASLTSLRSLALFHVGGWDCVTALTNLENLRLADDKWCSIPVGLTLLTRLTRLALANNDSRNAVPNHSFEFPDIDLDFPPVSRLPRLKEVSCFMKDDTSANQVNNMLMNATSITSLQVYAFFDMYDEPSFPPAIASLHNLRKLDLVYFVYTHHWPDNMTNLSMLTSLSITNKNCLAEQGIPDFVFSLTTLEHLAVNIMKGEERLPEKVSRLQHLRVLKLPASILLCRQVTQLQRLKRVQVDKWLKRDNDTEHISAVEELRRRGVTVCGYRG